MFTMGTLFFNEVRLKPQDAMLLDFLETEGLPTRVVATKVDRLSSGEKIKRSVERLHESLALPEGQPLVLSSKAGTGRNELWRAITELCTAPTES